MIGLSRIQRYILRENARMTMIVLGVIVVAILLVDTVEQLNTIGTRASLGLPAALGLALMKLPTLIEHTLPFTLLISSMLTFRQLSQRAELPVIRASGLSAWMFLAPVILLASLLGLVTMTIISPVGSNLTERYETIRTELLDRDISGAAIASNGIWLRDGDDLIQTVIHAQSIDDTGSLLSNVKFLQEDRVFDAVSETVSYKFARRLDAETARLQRGFWQLEGVTEYVPGQPVNMLDNLALPTELEQTTLTDRFSSPATIGFWTLPRQIRKSEQVGINSAALRMRWLSLTALPVMFVAMSLIGSLACLRLVRLGGTVPFIAFGVGSAIALFFISQVGSSFGATGAVPPLIAAWTPPVFTVLTCMALIAYREDG